tara:strand:+ start:49 stop:279 length:231 start_codon:yes stop_codon:yes gene_type:complete
MRRKYMNGKKRSPFRMFDPFPIGSLGERILNWKENKKNTMKIFKEDQKRTRQSTDQEQQAKSDAYAVEGKEINNEE